MRKPEHQHRILMTTDAVGGVWSYTVDLAFGLANRGCEIHIATMGPPPSAKQMAKVSHPGVFLYTSEHQLEWMDDPWEDVEKAGDWLIQLQEEIQPHLIHLNNYCHGDLAWQVPVVMVAHSCVLSWWQSVKGCTAPEGYQTYFSKVRNGLNAADILIAPTRHMLQEIYRIYDVEVPGVVIPNSSDYETANEASEAYTISIGRLWDEAKNITLVDEAAAYLNWPVIAVGDARHSHQSFKHLYPIGWCDQEKLKNLLAAAAIYVSPAKYEPFGLSILEAALSGCALVLGDIQSLRENWDGAALFTDTDDSMLLASIITMLEEDRELLLHYQQKARRRAKRFNSLKTVEAYLKNYQYLIDQHEPLKSTLA